MRITSLLSALLVAALIVGCYNNNDPVSGVTQLQAATSALGVSLQPLQFDSVLKTQPTAAQAYQLMQAMQGVGNGNYIFMVNEFGRLANTLPQITPALVTTNAGLPESGQYYAAGPLATDSAVAYAAQATSQNTTLFAFQLLRKQTNSTSWLAQINATMSQDLGTGTVTQYDIYNTNDAANVYASLSWGHDGGGYTYTYTGKPLAALGIANPSILLRVDVNPIAGNFQILSNSTVVSTVKWNANGLQ